MSRQLGKRAGGWEAAEGLRTSILLTAPTEPMEESETGGVALTGEYEHLQDGRSMQGGKKMTMHQYKR